MHQFIIGKPDGRRYFPIMTRDVGKEINLKPALIAAGVFSLLYLALGFFPENRWWGLNHLHFFAALPRFLYGVLMIFAVALLLTPPVRRFIDGPAVNPPGSVVYLQPIFWTVLFVLLRVSIYSMGDGYQRAVEIENGFVFKSTEMLDFFLHAVIYEALGIFGTIRATTAIAATSIAIGTVFVYILWKSDLFPDGRKYFFGFAVMSLGSSQLFFGYVESYTLVYLFGVWYMLLVFRSKESPTPLWLLSIVYCLAGFSHVIGLILLPSFIIAVNRRLKSHALRLLKLILFFLLGLMPLIIPQLLARFAIADDVRPLSEYFLPLFSGPYSAFSWLHLFDILNEFLLVAPILFMLAPLALAGSNSNGFHLRSLSIVIPALGFVLFIDPKLSMARDWDLFALPVVFCALPVIIAAFKSFDISRSGVPVRLSALILLSLFVTFSWILINNDRAANLRRTEYVLKQAVKGQKYGYELLAYYYSTHHDYENELRILQNISPLDRTAPIYGKMAQALYLLQRYDEAYQFAQTGARMPDPDRLNAIMAGLTAYQQKKFDEAVYYLRIASDLTGDPQWLCQLGDAYVQLDSLPSADSAYGQAMTASPDLACAYFGMAELYYRRTDYSQAATYCREGLRRDPGSQAGQALLRKIQSKQ